MACLLASTIAMVAFYMCQGRSSAEFKVLWLALAQDHSLFFPHTGFGCVFVKVHILTVANYKYPPERIHPESN